VAVVDGEAGVAKGSNPNTVIRSDRDGTLQDKRRGVVSMRAPWTAQTGERRGCMRPGIHDGRVRRARQGRVNLAFVRSDRLGRITMAGSLLGPVLSNEAPSTNGQFVVITDSLVQPGLVLLKEVINCSRTR
jgi:hypothetical protein